ncbi:4-hydroxythreonine-4-phosphate dehydrogenase PdxA [Luteitalea sp.]|jgi:4-hydroxythreonine-4-phosphate dehydrogenase|uniref:4-hydroxythreonine-4-phosphate dehydrogenase PdxA n=1 Tax=Luteitalea sp. TaxID=2004800 RepID=UPI0037C6070D
MSRFRPLLAITMGDPAGVGPEILLAALATPAMHERCRALVVGDARILERAARFLGAAGPALRFEVVRTPTDARFLDGHITVLDLANAPPDDCPVGQVSAASGRASVEYVFEACDLARRHEVDAIVTLPINKAAMNLGGHAYAGHTELLADRTKAGKVSMLLVGPKLRVVHVSTHVALEEAIGRVTRQRVGEVIDLAAQACRVLGVDAPRIAVAGLNPHAGEGGLFGHQEAREIVPAIEDARARGLDVSDPQPPDTVFLRAVRGAYDIVVAMYHDQGHIPMKLLAFDEGVNVSLGLPIIRTSVDHGTAFDIAGTGQARADSLHAAIDVALQMVRAREDAAARA